MDRSHLIGNLNDNNTQNPVSLNYANQHIAILGAGESGAGAALLAKKQGCGVFVSDSNPIDEFRKKELETSGIDFEENGHTNEKILQADYIVKSPGIPGNAPIIKVVNNASMPVISEIEFSGSFTRGKCIGITGTNGKTTTATLTYKILCDGGLDAGLAGNIGKSLGRQLVNKDHDYWVLELSSFQLDHIRHFKNHIGVLLNITPDHLDRYGYDIQNYIRSKFRITLNQDHNNYFIYNSDDSNIQKGLKTQNLVSHLLPFSQEKKPKLGAYIGHEAIYLKTKKNENNTVMTLEELGIQGKTNPGNTMAASVVGRLLEIRKEVIRESLKNFKNLEHRLEPVITIQGIEFINDSKGTNVNATWYALGSLTKPVIWIAGGLDKGNDYSQLMPLVKETVKAIVCIGENNNKLAIAFKNKIKTFYEATSMDEAVSISYRLAGKGDAVLLSPACASFDRFDNYEDRGNRFKKAVKKL